MSQPRDYVPHLDESLLSEILNLAEHLPERDKQMLREYYMEGRTLEEIGKTHTVSKQRIYQILARTAKKLREAYFEENSERTNTISEEKKRKGVPHLKLQIYDDGEMVLASILSKTPQKWGKQKENADIINKLFHEGKEVIDTIRYNSLYHSPRLPKIREKYFPRQPSQPL